MVIELRLADYSDNKDASAILTLLNDYARGPHGGGKPLDEFVRSNLISTLASMPHAFTVLGHRGGEPVALANCFCGLSTFACKPLVNIHDLVIAESAQRQGASQALLSFVESHARELGCCKITLEVLELHVAARGAYDKFGFVPYTLDDHAGRAIFMHKALESLAEIE